MNHEDLEKIKETLEKSDVLKTLKTLFDRAFKFEFSEVNGKLRVDFIETDAGQEFMTVGDVASLLLMERKAVRQMCEARAQSSSVHPLPFFRVGKSLRFRRSEIIKWVEAKAGESAIQPPPKGKVKKTR